VENALVYDQTELDHIESLLIAAGHEGGIIRGPDTRYKFGRGTNSKGDLLKLKRFVDSEAVVIGVEEELHNANEATTNALGRTERSSHKANKVGKGTLGALVVRLLADHGDIKAGTEFRIGTGFTAAMRASLWTEAIRRLDATGSPGGLDGRIAKFKWFPVGSKDAPRHPVFLGWRSPDDL
jgi:DNA ligase-1